MVWRLSKGDQMASIRIHCVHGLGDHRQSNWRDTWAKSVKDVFPGRDSISLDFSYTAYDDIFEGVDIDAWKSARALAKLAKSGLASVFSREKGVLSNISDRIRWTAGYVVAWVEDEAFKKATRKRVLDDIRQYRPDVILGHSLGSLVTYNAFSHTDAQADDIAAILKEARYVTLGSQIGNPFVIRNLTPGKIDRLGVKSWHHLYNTNDDVFTAPLKLADIPEFRQVETPFDLDGFGDHAAESYLSHKATVENLWRLVVEDGSPEARSFGLSRSFRKPPAKAKRPKSAARRALLVGINEYPEEDQRLQGCVNDVFTMSSVLQECGFEPASIRTVLDERATTEGILSRLDWLLDEPQPGDERVFYYSGHGVAIPEYGEDNEPDHMVEALVPHDFDWTPEKCISDDQIYSLYSQLPYDFRLIMIFDCCHSGGVHRQGGAKARGITPPDDVRHRQLRWDRGTKMWVDRAFKPINDRFSSTSKDNAAFFGRDGSTERLGRASMLRGLTKAEATRRKAAGLSTGPYLPLIIEACGENQLSYEYRHGAHSYGAFTYCLAKILEEQKKISFENLVARTGEKLAKLQYDQVPQILGPTEIMRADVPWLDAKPARAKARPVPSRARRGGVRKRA
jgi:metacaspase-1